MMIIISLKMKNLGFKIFFLSDFSADDICLNDHAGSQKIAKPFNPILPGGGGKKCPNTNFLFWSRVKKKEG